MTSTYRIVGYTADAETWCIGCTIDRYGEPEDVPGAIATLDREGNPVQPVFAGSEWDYQPACHNYPECGNVLDVGVIPHGGGDMLDVVAVAL